MVSVQRRVGCCKSGAIPKDVGESELPKVHSGPESKIEVAVENWRHRV
jgi:hypothetical protein